MRRTAISNTRRARVVSLTVTLGLAALLVSTWAGPAAAHQSQRVGSYRFVVGFGDEPAYAGQRNSVQLMLSTAAGKPVTNLGDTLSVMVMTGDQTQELTLEPFFEVGEFGTPGDYRAFFIPSTPGRFTFHFQGTIKGQRVDKDFTSGPRSFGDVDDPVQAAFPKLDQPSNAQIAQRLDRETARLNGTAQVADRRTRETAGKVTVLSILGPFGLVLGLFGMVMTGIALRTAKRALATAAEATAPVPPLPPLPSVPPVPFQEEALRSRVEV